MKYVLLGILLIATLSFGMVWCISHFWFILKVMVPLGFLASFIGGTMVGWRLRGGGKGGAFWD